MTKIIIDALGADAGAKMVALAIQSVLKKTCVFLCCCRSFVRSRTGIGRL